MGLPADPSWADKVHVEFYEAIPTNRDDQRKILHVRSGYRHEPDFTVSGFTRLGSVFDGPRVSRLIDSDVTVSQNYQRLVSASIEGLYGGRFDDRSGREIREYFIGQVRESMLRVFDDLVLSGPGDPLGSGSFYFEKGISKGFHYKNLSAGEKAAFDLLLDLHVKLISYDNTVFCIDEPELHMHARLQARLLDELYRLIPANSQLWIATHSIGMLRKAQDLSREQPGTVAFLDFHAQDFDQPVVLTPAKADRQLWIRHLGTAVDDLATLIAPDHVVLCEGDPVAGGARGDFDARCYREMFADELPQVDFMSVGNEHEVIGDRRWLGRAIQQIVSGTRLTRLIDRDNRTASEIEDLERVGVRVLSRRHLESYLLDDAVLTELCARQGKPEKVTEVLAAKSDALVAAQRRGAENDDVKAAAGDFYVAARRILQLSQMGNTAEAFMRDTLAPLIPQVRPVYDELKASIFGEPAARRETQSSTP